MNTRHATFTHRPRKSLVALAFVALTLGACGTAETDTTVGSAPTLDEAVVIDPAILVEEATEQVVEVVAEPVVSPPLPPLSQTSIFPPPVETPEATAPAATTAPAPEAAPATTTAPVLEVILPSDLDNAQPNENRYPHPLGELQVVTAEDDPLNVRTGPGVEFAIVDEFAHRSRGIMTTHSVSLDSGTIWQFITQGDLVGWVNGSYLEPAADTNTCTAPSREVATADWQQIGDVRFGDLDGDGLEDSVWAYHEGIVTEHNGGTFNQDAYHLYIEFGNDGTSVSSPSVGFYHPAESGIRAITEMHYLASEPGGEEIIFGVSAGASTAQMVVLVLDDCSLVEATLNGGQTSLLLGATVGHSNSFGCAFGAHGERSVQSYRDSQNPGFTWSSITIELRGTEWLYIDDRTSDDFPSDYVPPVPDPTTCGF